jgi:hypothetical protein
LSRSEGQAVGYIFAGGSRDKTESAPDLVPDDAFRYPSHGALVRLEGSPASEFYVLRDDGRAHYRFTVSPYKWGRGGDPCPACGGRATELLATRTFPGGVIPTIGGESFRADAEHYALVQCRECMLPHWVPLEKLGVSPAPPRELRPPAALPTGTFVCQIPGAA